MFSSIFKKRGSVILISLSLTAILLIFVTAVSNVVISFIKRTNNVEVMNQAYFAAEAGLEDALYDITQHLSGYEKETSFTDIFEEVSIKNRWKVESRVPKHTDGNYYIPQRGKGTSLADQTKNWNSLKQNESLVFDLFLDNAKHMGKTKDNDIINPKDSGFSTLDIHVRLPQDGNNYALENTGTGIIAWIISGISKDNPSVRYKLTGSGCMLGSGNLGSPDGSIICDGDLMDQNETINELKEGSTESGADALSTIHDFLTDNRGQNKRIHKPQLKLSLIGKLEDSSGNKIPFLEYQIRSNIQLPDLYTKITSEGVSGGYRQTIQTSIKQKSTVPLFDYAVFQ